MPGIFNNIVENRINVNDEYLDSKLNEIFFDGVRIFFVNHKIRKDRTYQSNGKYPNIQMQFALEGTNTARSKVTGEFYRLKNNQHNLIYFPHINVDYKIEGTHARFLGVQFYENYFYHFVDENSRILSNFWTRIEKKEEAFLVRERNFTVTPKIKMILSEIMNTNREGHLKKLFLESKIIELFMLQFEQAEFYGKNLLKINKYDRDKLYFVKELLEQNILSEFTLREISYKSGLNEFKLKKGFKELFGKTVFNYFNDLRMNYAKDLIINDKKKVFEVSYLLGYSEPHHFTHAFKKKFGILPGTLK
jgi:AraC-like DNA-binding protein